MTLSFTVAGEPQGKGRPKFARRGQYVQTYTPDRTIVYENLIKLEYERQCGHRKYDPDTPLSVEITAYYGIPKSASKKRQNEMRCHLIRPIKKVDVDNIVKVFLDALNGLAYKDDIQVVDCHVRKFYNDNPHVKVSIKEAELEDDYEQEP